MVYIDYQDGTPIYEQIVNRYKNLIASGVLQPEEKMPSVRNLAMELSINPNTIQRAYGELERQGYIYSVKGRGNFVSNNAGLKEQKQKELLTRLDGLMEEARDAGIPWEVLTAHMESRKKEGKGNDTTGKCDEML